MIILFYFLFSLFLQATKKVESERKCLLSKNTHIYMPIPHPHQLLSVTPVLQIPINLQQVYKIIHIKR